MMLNEQKREEVLARIGPVLAVALTETTGTAWIFIPQPAADFAILLRRDDEMRISMMPGWFDKGDRFEFAPYIQIDGIAHTLGSLGLAAHGNNCLRIHATTTRGVEAIAHDLVRRVVVPYEKHFPGVLARASQTTTARDAQRQVADAIAGLTGATQEHRGDDINLWPDVCGVSLPLRVTPGGAIELGRTNVTHAQVAAIVAGLKRADRLRAGRHA